MKQLNHTQGMLFNLTTQEDKQIFSNKKHENIGRKTVICFQRILREQKAKQELRTPITNLNGCTVSEVSSSEARKIIEAYEWLGTMGRTQFSIGLHSPSNELLGVACFGLPGSQESRNICGPKYIASSICLERGACVPHAPKNAASFLISHACKISAQRGYPIVYAYADEDAGEMGTVYQACNWIYIGQGVGRSPGRKREYYRNPQTGETIASRTLRHRGLTKKTIIGLGWEVLYQAPKHKYVWIGNPKRNEMMRNLRYAPKPYPKRQVFNVSANMISEMLPSENK